MLEHRIAKLAAGAAFLLLIIGGLVNATGSSLACPEAFVICKKSILPEMTGGVLFEHGHRLVAMTVGLVQIALTIALWIRRPALRRLGVLLLGMILLQGLFGATTVKFKLVWWVSTGHLLLGTAYFAMLIYTVFRTRRVMTAGEVVEHERQRAELGSIRNWITAACVMVFVQLLLGGLVRHLGAALVCIGMPGCSPNSALPDGGLQTLHMIHRTFGTIVGIVTIIAAIKVFAHAKSWPRLRAFVALAPVLVVAQITLGVFTVLTMRAVPLAVAHFAGGESLWALWIYAWLMTGRYVPESPASGGDAEPTAVPGASS
ncbi:MAG TPA: COX15/CtaA family protein [Kofleriaceae bacterium]|jgi:cytochrome c oxidase assembly protein subunit 15|nr:COX15/CtaA family protein [Kofleriaceae bacterium]